MSVSTEEQIQEQFQKLAEEAKTNPTVIRDHLEQLVQVAVTDPDRNNAIVARKAVIKMLRFSKQFYDTISEVRYISEAPENLFIPEGDDIMDQFLELHNLIGFYTFLLANLIYPKNTHTMTKEMKGFQVDIQEYVATTAVKSDNARKGFQDLEDSIHRYLVYAPALDANLDRMLPAPSEVIDADAFSANMFVEFFKSAIMNKESRERSVLMEGVRMLLDLMGYAFKIVPMIFRKS